MASNLKAVEEQLELPGIKLGELVREWIGLETEKKDANDEWNHRIKVLKKEIARVAASMDPD